MKKCAFCQKYKEASQINKKSDYEMNRENQGARVKTELRAAMTIETYKHIEGKRIRVATVTLRSRPLRFCPECGNNLRGRR